MFNNNNLYKDQVSTHDMTTYATKNKSKYYDEKQ